MYEKEIKAWMQNAGKLVATDEVMRKLFPNSWKPEDSDADDADIDSQIEFGPLLQGLVDDRPETAENPALLP